MRKIFILFGIVFSGFIFGQDFKFAYSNDECNVYLKEEGDYKFWVRYDKKQKAYKNKQGKFIKTGGGEALLSLRKYDCKKKTSSNKVIISYDGNGRVKSSQDYGFFIEEQSIVPGTVGEEIFDLVCGNKGYPEDEYQKGFEEGYIDIMCEEYVIDLEIKRGSEASASETNCPYLNKIPVVLFNKNIPEIYYGNYFSAGYDEGMKKAYAIKKRK